MRKFLVAVTLAAFTLSCGPKSTDSTTLPSGNNPTDGAGDTADKLGIKAPPAPLKRGSFVYPAAERVDHFDTYHGTKVHDPYRWLEDPDSKQSRAWIEGENQVTFPYLAAIPERAWIKKRLTTLWNYERFSTPYNKAGKYFFSKNDGLQNQSVAYWTKSLRSEPSVLFDPNKWSDDGTVALAGMKVSEDGKIAAYGVQKSGSDWRQWKFRDIATGKDLPDTLDFIKFSSPSWAHDNKGVFYSRFPEPKKGQDLREANFNSKLYYHKLGTAQSDDVIVFENPKEPKHSSYGWVTEDGKYFVMNTGKGTGNVNLVHYQPLAKGQVPTPDKFKPIIGEWIGDFSYVGNDGPRFYFFSDYKAPRGKLIQIDVRKPEMANWKQLIPEGKNTLKSVGMLGNSFFANWMQDAKSVITMHDLRGRKLRDVKLPGIGTAGGIDGRRDQREAFYAYSSFTEPTSIYRFNLRSKKSNLWKKPKVEFDGTKYETKQEFVTSKDGTKVPIFIVHKKGLELDGNNPTLLYGYGGFNISMRPYFSVTRAVWMEMGGVYAVANLRGGGEYGEEWHKAGTKLQKQNVFDDFIASAEWLIANKYTKAEKLAIQGGSNGGLLVGAMITQRPELFGAALPAVGVMDMLRFHKFTIGWAWIDDYGSSDDPAEFKALRAYSPYHNLVPGTKFPATMVTTADHDDRVVPGHSFKFAAALQYAQGGDAPVLIRIDTKAGHGGGTPTSKRIEQATDSWAFLVKSLGMKLEVKPKAPQASK